MADQFSVVDNAADSRYEAHAPDGTVMGVLRYERVGDVVVMPSTVTLPEFRGRGVAGALTQRALDDAAAAGRKVQARCWYVAEYIERHPQYAALAV